ncbi:MAG: hypothetical protein WC613_04155 [Candidatus Aenigmatarchaeota archaeon]
MIFPTKDEKVEHLERKINEMEKRMDVNINKMNQTVVTLREIILRLQSENTQLRSERDFLVERHKKMLKRVPVPDLATEINERLIRPATNKIRENVDFVQLIAKEGFVEIQEPGKKRPKKVEVKDPSVTAKELKDHISDAPKPNYGKSIDNFFEIVSKAGKIRSDEAARKLNVHQIQIEEWAKILESHDLVTLKKTHIGKMEIIKV